MSDDADPQKDHLEKAWAEFINALSESFTQALRDAADELRQTRDDKHDADDT